jgi:superfamily II DNA or RNA helicase
MKHTGSANGLWQKRLGHYFSKKIKQRGQRYAQNGHVRLKKVDQSSIACLVEGSLDYAVDIIAEESGERFKVFCSCPHFAGGSACKHLWAALVAADEALSLSDSSASDSPADWQALLFGEEADASPPSWIGAPGSFCIYYTAEVRSGTLFLSAYQQYIKKDGGLGRSKDIDWRPLQSPQLPQADRIILQSLVARSSRPGWGENPWRGVHRLSSDEAVFLLPYLAQTERCQAVLGPNQSIWPLQCGHPYTAQLRFSLPDRAGSESEGAYTFQPEIVFLDQGTKAPAPMEEVDLFLGSTQVVFFYHQRLHELRGADMKQLERLRANHFKVPVPSDQLGGLLQALERPQLQERIDLPEDIGPTVRDEIQPKPCFQISFDEASLQGSCFFSYDGLDVQPTDSRQRLLDTERWIFIERQKHQEASWLQDIDQAGFRQDIHGFSHPLEGAAEAIASLLGAGWHVEGKDKKPFKSSSTPSLRVKSDLDWFDVHGDIPFDDFSVPLPRALRSYLRGERFVALGDGSTGVLPERWLKEHSQSLSLGLENAPGKDAGADQSSLRYHPGQALAVDRMVEDSQAPELSERFIRIRDELRKFTGVQALPAPDEFMGSLRDYQKDALGWFDFLRRFGFGGVLADDMGLGKTIQVLAWLLYRRNNQAARPALIVAPTSLVLNWQREAARFTPQLSLLVYTGQSRAKHRDTLADYDLVVTSYGLLRRDMAILQEITFDTVILDESQAIKNKNSKAFQAAKALQAEHRLCLTGTPLENNLLELWSQMDFLNPGLLGSAKRFEDILAKPVNGGDGSAHRTLDPLIKPFILRRRKEEVASELPDKEEHILSCSMSKAQSSLYHQVKEHYRGRILASVEGQGLNRSKMKVLEGLLRLRQIACHPGLVDSKLTDSGKMDKLWELLSEITSAGHKALIFSQFTSFLGLLKKQLQAAGYTYLYLDGRTPQKTRQQRVQLFQDDPGIPLFLISLKAGGTGLNLTAADYVFILDPWWNPAVEMQAVDRTHRIGQDKTVFTYRLITESSVEEKVLTLQEQKREMVQSVLAGSKNLLQDLSREDLEHLFA